MKFKSGNTHQNKKFLAGISRASSDKFKHGKVKHEKIKRRTKSKKI